LNWDSHRISPFSFQQATDHKPLPTNPKTCPTDLGSIIYTSGSTGKPKGAMLSHGNMVANTTAICDYLQLGPSDIHMVVLPFFYVMGKSLLNTHFAVGGTVVINNRFAYPAAVLKQMADEAVTGFSGVPSTYAYLLHRSPIREYKTRLNALRYCAQAGGHMARTLKMRLQEVLPDHTAIYIMYGATEGAARLAFLEPEQFENKMDSIGKPIPGVRITILDADGCEVQPGQTGELNASGPNVMSGYWKDGEASDRVLGPYGYRTGDMGYVDADGYFYITGRRDNTVKVGGHRINTQEVEDLLLSTELIVETAVCGIKDDLLGHQLKALIVPRDKTTDEMMIVRACSQTMPKQKIPSEFIPVRTIPKMANGKTDRRKCLSMISSLST
jgi:long-chain acyl-CoA synthetase